MLMNTAMQLGHFIRSRRKLRTGDDIPSGANRNTSATAGNIDCGKAGESFDVDYLLAFPRDIRGSHKSGLQSSLLFSQAWLPFVATSETGGCVMQKVANLGWIRLYGSGRSRRCGKLILMLDWGIFQGVRSRRKNCVSTRWLRG